MLLAGNVRGLSLNNSCVGSVGERGLMIGSSLAKRRHGTHLFMTSARSQLLSKLWLHSRQLFIYIKPRISFKLVIVVNYYTQFLNDIIRRTGSSLVFLIYIKNKSPGTLSIVSIIENKKQNK